MHIKRKRLTEPVVIAGKNFFGESCAITFTPHHDHGWWWDTKYSGIIPIDYRIARPKKGGIQLFAPGETLNGWEHLGPLRFLGIDAVKVRMDFDSRPPYFTAGQYETYFAGNTEETDEYIPTISVQNEYAHSVGNHCLSEVLIKPADQLLLHVLSQWEDLPESGSCLDERQLFAASFFKNVFEAKRQGFYRRKLLAKMMKIMYRCPHGKQFAWKSDFDVPEDTAYAWWLHAVQEALGEISLASHDALPVGRFLRFKVGHTQMLKAIKKSFS